LALERVKLDKVGPKVLALKSFEKRRLKKISQIGTNREFFLPK
jgi:hypothetical protein